MGDLTPFLKYFQELIQMNSKSIKIPGPDHPITITPTKGRVTVVVNGTRVANPERRLP